VATRKVFTPILLTCLVLTAAVHIATYVLSVVLPLHVVALGGTPTQVGMLFSVSAAAAMFLRPVVGGWVDRLGVRPVLLPGVAILAVTSVAFHVAATPASVILLMLGVGVAAALVSTSAGVLAAQATADAYRGEALSVYYVATSVAMAVAAPAGLVLFRIGGARLAFVAVTAIAAVLLGVVLSPATRTAPTARAAVGRWRLWSRHALASSGALILVTLGHSSLYGFLPLHAIRNGLEHHLGWFFALYSVWLVLCRVVLRRASDRLGRAAVVVPSMAASALGYAVLAMPLSAVSLAAAALLLGTGASLLYPTLVAQLVDRAPAEERGLAIGTLSGSYDLGMVIGSFMIGVVVERASYPAAFVVAAAATGLGLASYVAAEQSRTRRAVFSGPSPGV
jgi:MFS family permease